MSRSDYLEVENMLGSLGYNDESAMAAAWLTLEREGLVEPRKRVIAKRHLARVRRILKPEKTQVCSNICSYITKALQGDSREHLLVDPISCQVCLGSRNRQVAASMSTVLRIKGISKVVVVGGSEQVQDELAKLLQGKGIQFRFINGQKSSGNKVAQNNRRWAELVIIWPHFLKHSQSWGYTVEASEGKDFIVVRRGGIKELCMEVVRHYDPQSPFLSAN